ncbi:hypothetical protein K7B06_00315 [Streptomyces erythrochromogenes]|uniref:hypothetical protein n=1 Tax=Streptomyces yangpuensis TaxID=1648182 RepID=UPI0034136FB8|nr:hypothetical protein [Streptomyces erythrochromogenes]
MADNTTGQTPTGRWLALSAREVSCLAAGAVLIAAGQLWYWLADGTAPATTPTARWFQTAAAAGAGLWLQILGVLLLMGALLRPALRRTDRS